MINEPPPDATHRQALVREMKIVPFAQKPPLPPWSVLLSRVLGMSLLLAFCLICWAVVIAALMLGVLWAIPGTLLACACFACAIRCFSERTER